MLPGPAPLWGPGSIFGNWADACGFLESPESDRLWKVRLHGAFSKHRDVLGLRRNDQSCHHEAWLHLDLVGWHDVQPQRAKHCQRILLKERSSPYQHGRKSGRISEIMSDHSLSSRHRDHSCTLVRRSTSRVLLASSPSDLMTLLTLSNSCTCLVHSFCSSVPIARMTIPTRRATKKIHQRLKPLRGVTIQWFSLFSRVRNWRIMQASGNRARYCQAQRRFVRHSREHDRI